MRTYGKSKKISIGLYSIVILRNGILLEHCRRVFELWWPLQRQFQRHTVFAQSVKIQVSMNIVPKGTRALPGLD